MYSDITDIFLSSIRALRFYVNSVEENIDYPMTEVNEVSAETISALLMRVVLMGKKHGRILTDDIRLFK